MSITNKILLFILGFLRAFILTSIIVIGTKLGLEVFTAIVISGIGGFMTVKLEQERLNGEIK